MKRLHLIIFIALLSGVTAVAKKHKQLVILHTNDTHSTIMPLNENLDNKDLAGRGGFLRRINMIKEQRAQHPDLLLFDSGDFSQGSGYYTLFKGEVEVGLMNQMGYDCATIGNHEFDFGLENLAHLMRTAEFPFVCCNYDFTGTPCEGLTKPYIIKERAGVRVGIFGVCPQPQGLITAKNFEGMRYTKPAKAAQPVIDHLRNNEHCDVVVCLSHLGWGEAPDMDIDFISSTTGIDILLGGHSHTYFEKPQYLSDKQGHQVIVDHQGKNARFLGTIEVGL